MVISVIVVSGSFSVGNIVQEPSPNESATTDHSCSARSTHSTRSTSYTRSTPSVNIGPDRSGSGKFGEVVVYNLTVTNLQAVPDNIDITYMSAPNGWSVTLFENDGVTLLHDTPSDGDGIPDTGLLMYNGSINITVKITIPSDKFINEPENTTIYARSSAEPSDPGDLANLITIANPFLDIKQHTEPTMIYVDSSEIYGFNTRSRITLNVTGGGLPSTKGKSLDVVLTLDNSGSMAGAPINGLVNAANNFINKLGDEDRVAIYCYRLVWFATPRLLQDWTFMTPAGKTAAHNAINGLLSDTNHGTPLWDTIYDAIGKASVPVKGRRPIVIAMTDGVNTRDNYGVVVPQGPWPPYNNDGNANDDWATPPITQGLCEAPLTVFTIGLGIIPGSSNENSMKEIALSSNPAGEYYYAPSSNDLDKIYNAIAKKIMKVSGEDPDPTDNKPMMTYVLPDYINYVKGSFILEHNSIETDPDPDKIIEDTSSTTLSWEVKTIYINDTWSVSFEVTSTKIGWVPVNLYPDSNVYYTNSVFPNLTIPFPEIWIEVLPLPTPDLVITNIMVDHTPYLSSDHMIAVETGQEVEISGQVKNIGSGATSIFSDTFKLIFYNSNSPFNPFFSTYVGALEPSKISPISRSTWRSPKAEGIYEIILFVDYDNIIPEGADGEQNNKIKITFQVEKPVFVDLILTDITIDDLIYDITSINFDLKIDSEVDINARAKNLGNVDTNFYSPDFHIAFYNSTTPFIPFLDVVIVSLAPSEKTTENRFNWKAPAIPGIYEVILFVDSTDAIPENDLSGEANNKIRIIFNVTQYLVVDLIIGEVEINDISNTSNLLTPTYIDTTHTTSIELDLVTGQTIIISSQAMNFGNADTNIFSSKFDISYYETSIPAANPIEPFFHRSIVSLSPLNLSAKYLSYWTAPLIPDTYNIVLFVDSADEIPEGLDLEYENNNIFEIEIHVHELPPPPSPHLTVSGNNVIIEWNTTREVAQAQYSIYGGCTPQTIDLTEPLGYSKSDLWVHEACLIEYSEFYYIIHSVDVRGWEGPSSGIIGFKTITFKKGYNTFSLPLEPFIIHSADWYADDIFYGESDDGVIFEYRASLQKWIGHPKGLPGGINDFDLLVGETYMIHISTAEELKYTFIGRPGTDIRYLAGIIGDPRLGSAIEFRENLILTQGTNGVVLNWKCAADVNEFEKADHYNIYRSKKRGAYDFIDLLALTPPGHPEITTYTDTDIDMDMGKEYYYLVVPVNQFGREGSSTYSMGMIVKYYFRGYNDFSLPLHLSPITIVNGNKSSVVEFSEPQFSDMGIDADTLYYYNHSLQKWIGIPRSYPAGQTEKLVAGKGYLIYVAAEVIKFSFIGK